MICLSLQKMRQKNNISAYPGRFLRTEIDSMDFKNENLTAKTRQKSHVFKKKKYSMIIEDNEQKSSSLKSIAVK